jgi:hypothetical protein
LGICIRKTKASSESEEAFVFLSQSQLLCDKKKKAGKYPAFFVYDEKYDGDYIVKSSSLFMFSRFNSKEQ